MKPQMNRRTAIAALGSAGLGGLLVACSNGDDDAVEGAESTNTTSTSTSTTTAAPTAAAGSTDLASRFEEASSCSLTPEETEGPYYIDVDSIRSDIRDGRPGKDLKVGIRVLDENCDPVPDAVVEIWHCDGAGVYSGFDDDTTRDLRGGQVTDTAGIAQILTIYPGWYQGRTVHIHTKVHINNAEALTTQLFFDDTVSDALFESTSPYDEHTGRQTTNENDGIFLDDTLLTLAEDGDGYLGLITLNVDRG